MNCRSHREELSRCLDGRLQGHARARVMGHVAKCDGCARFWRELKAAQELVLGLPQIKVGPRFRDDVWQRIQSGEAAPDLIAPQPVPLPAKVRYGLLGAAAAAAFILAVHHGLGTSPARQEPPRVDRVATGTPDDDTAASNTTEQTRRPSFPASTVADLNPANLAAKTAEQVSVAARSLRNRSKNLTNPSDFRPEVIQAVRRDIETVQSGLIMLRQLQQHGFGIELRDDQARDCLMQVLTTLEISPKLEQPEQVMRIIPKLTGCSLDRLPEKLRFSLDSARLDPRFMAFLRQMEAQHLRILRQMQILSLSHGHPGKMGFIFHVFPPQVPGRQAPQEQEQAPHKLREHSRR